MPQPTLREINRHLLSGVGYCMVHAPGFQMRISRARRRKGVIEGRVINYRLHAGNVRTVIKDWEPIPADAQVELS